MELMKAVTIQLFLISFLFSPVCSQVIPTTLYFQYLRSLPVPKYLPVPKEQERMVIKNIFVSKYYAVLCSICANFIHKFLSFFK